jgi:1-deoxy-D-xylulose-5-phosphate synthase
VYCTFLQRAFDQAFQEVSLQGLPVRLCLDRAGLVGGDGAVHHGFCDTALLRTLPNAVITAAIDEPSLKAALEFMRAWDSSLSSVRYPRDSVSNRFADEACPPFELGKARALNTVDRPDAAILAFGTLAMEAMEAAANLSPEIRLSVYDARFAKPIDRALLRELLEARIPVLTLEDHSVVGGFGSAVLEAASEMGLDTSRVRVLGLPDSWIYQDDRRAQLAEAGLDASGIARAVRTLLSESPPDLTKPSDRRAPTTSANG